MPAKRGGTDCGFHFLEAYKACKRKFYIRYVLGIEPDRVPYQLVFGGAFHEAKAVFYTTGREDRAQAAFSAYLDDHGDEVLEAGRYLKDMTHRGPLMLKRWIRLFGKQDLVVYDLLAIEEEITFRLPNGMVFTAKPDLVTRSDGGVYIFDTKTSWFSGYLQAEQLETSDQGTTYLYAWNLKHPRQRAIGLVPDCIYWNMASTDEEKIIVNRSRLVTRSPREMEEWVLGTMSDLEDMVGRVRALSTTDEAILFPRTTSYCLSYNRVCEYRDICRHRIKGIPSGFHEETWKGKVQLLGNSKRSKR